MAVIKDLKINPEHFGVDKKPLGLRRWKNVGLLCSILQTLKDKGVVKTGETFETRGLAKLIRDNNLDSNWNLDKWAKDNHGLERSIGDTVGGHGLGLKKISARRYQMPNVLPEVEGDTVIKEAIYGGDYATEKRVKKTYVGVLTHKDGVYRISIPFEGKLYGHASSNPERVVEVLNPVTVDPHSGELAKKDNIRQSVNLSMREPKRTVTFHLDASIYQKLYGAHSPGRDVFQIIK